MTSIHEAFFYMDGLLMRKMKTSNRCNLNKPAGTLNGNGYLVVSFNNRLCRVHRIIWEMHNGPIIDGMEIDHIDGDRKNNRIENLRLVTRTINNLNQKMKSNNTSGFTGVYFSKEANLWYAVFMKKKIGYFKSFEEACIARDKACKDSNMTTERHGK